MKNKFIEFMTRLSYSHSKLIKILRSTLGFQQKTESKNGQAEQDLFPQQDQHDRKNHHPTRIRDDIPMTWSPTTLRKILKEDLSGEEVMIISNREPYLHMQTDGTIQVQLPASGMVTALEPIMRACSGTWIAHGSGSADRMVVDEFDRVDVPPQHPFYKLRRIWLSAQEEIGYYLGFSNEGLWPLCHIAHTRPIFRSSDWNDYVTVNKKFAEAALSEAKTNDPLILVQDYHLALLPKMIRNKLPNATIITFWHIPWPNPEAFSICPWKDELLRGLLGSDIVGFHTKFHCHNFIQTVDRNLESRIDHTTSTISFQHKRTAVHHYPISIEWPPRWLSALPSVDICRDNILKRHHLDPQKEGRFIGVGVDRLDYTKGLLERFLAIERLLELHPEWAGQFTFIQIAALSRSNIQDYKIFADRLFELTERINKKFSQYPPHGPVILLTQHHEPNQVYEYYRSANVCLVTSLHDGMNLVAKEFIAARDDEKGVLILSQFTGASAELPEALAVNPYNIDECADVLHRALSMPESEQQERMRSMRLLVKEFNVYRWAGRMLLDAAQVRRHQRLLGRTSFRR